MGRYSGTLHRLVDGANSANSKTSWSQVLHYLESHTVGNATAENPAFESPLPPYTSPSVELELDLFDQQGPKREDTPLKIAIKSAPANVVAALCHLGPEAARMADSRDRLPLHWACRRSSMDPETDNVLKILITCYPAGLLHRDDGGRTPLHWLFWYHAPSRSPKIVEHFCKLLPLSDFKDMKQPLGSSKERYPLPDIPVPTTQEDIPPCALIVHDARHGALPLHYAVMQGASKDVVKLLLTAYPTSRALGDRKGRTALAWYLGAGHLIDNKKHICGESNDPNATPWWEMKLSSSVLQLLVTSRVARLVDDTRRHPLHWACHLYARSLHANNSNCVSVKMIQILLDNCIDALTSKDLNGKTPLQILFDVVIELQDLDYKRHLANRTLRDNIDLRNGGPVAFKPPLQLIELLIKSPETDGQDQQLFRFETNRDDRATSAVACEDRSGCLPLHSALRVASSSLVIQLLIQSNPTSLIHTTEELLQTPLIHALSSPYTAPLQSLETIELMMAAYVTSRHGTFMDGRLALKMEDANGKYPIHYACQNQASLEVVKFFVEKFPRSALFQNSDGDLPVHCLLSQQHFFEPPDSGIIVGASLSQPLGLLTEKEKSWQEQVRKINKEKIKILLEPLTSKQQLKITSSAHGMTPLHVAVAFDAAPYTMVYRMLDTYPDAARLLTTAKGFEFSCLDLHELHKDETDDYDRWAAIRELLFSFHPSLKTHRQKEELLDSCVKLIRNEVLGRGSYHLDQAQMATLKTAPTVDLSETLSAIEVPEMECSHRPKNFAKANQQLSKKKTLKSPKSPKNLAKAPSNNEVEKSIYDDGLEGRYIVSPENSEVDDEESIDESVSSEEEYTSGESGSEEDSFDGTSMEHASTRSSWDRQTSTDRSSWDRGTDRSSWDRGTDRSSWGHSATESFTKSPKKHHHDEAHSKHADEKKEENPKEASRSSYDGPFLSDVAMRLWCFFVLYNNPKNPKDNYLKQVEAVIDELDFNIIDRLINLQVPSYAQEFLEQGTSTLGTTLRELASPRPKALFESVFYFLGRYEFSAQKEGALLHRSSDNSTVLLRATEHILKTEEYKPPTEYDPGTVEEAIWTKGEVIPEEKGYMASKFGHFARTVYFKFTRHQEAYENEVQCRADMGIPSQYSSRSHILPLMKHFSKDGNNRDDRRYKMDVTDPRFETLKLYGGESIRLSDYAYALVFPYCDEGDLFDYFYHRGVDDTEEIADIGLQVGKSLEMIHEKGVVHGNISARTIAMTPSADDGRRCWALTDFSNSCRPKSGTSYMGSIAHNGSAQFSTALLPPEMFVKLTVGEASIYKAYWDQVEARFGIKADRRVVKPFVNLATGSTYVLRCHYVPADAKDSDFPSLPYKLVPVRESADIWGFGVLLFTLCSGGRPLFPSNWKTGHLLEYESIVDWNQEVAASIIYEHVRDPLAQDLLLHLLAPYDDRVDLTMETVLSHPFLSGSDKSSALRRKVIEQRKQESIAHERWRQRIVTERSVNDWLKSRTVEVHCWNFDTLRRIHFSSSEMTRKLVGREIEALAMPCSFIILPYKLSAKNKKAKLAPTTKKDVERAERMGIILLSLSKACHFAVKVKEAVNSGTGSTASKLIESLSLPSDFESMKNEMIKLAAEHVEVFRSNPSAIALKLVARRILDLKACFEDSKKAFLYLVDEYDGVPLAGSSYAPYPLEITQQAVDQILTKGLPFMHLCALYVRCASRSVSGLVRLIFEAAYPHIPPSWAVASKGLSNTLDDTSILQETTVLREALSSMTYMKLVSAADDLDFLRSYILKVDVRRSFADMQRVTCGGSSLWTTPKGATDLQEAAQSYGFKDAHEIQMSLERRLKLQEQQIKKLRVEMERMNFRKDYNLLDMAVDDVSEKSEQVNNPNAPFFQKRPAKGSQVDKNCMIVDVRSVASNISATTMIFEEKKGEMEFHETDPKQMRIGAENDDVSTKSLGTNLSTVEDARVKPEKDPLKIDVSPPTQKPDVSFPREASGTLETTAPDTAMPSNSALTSQNHGSSPREDASGTKENQVLGQENSTTEVQAAVDSSSQPEGNQGEDEVQALSDMMQVLEVTSREQSAVNDLAAPDTFPSNVCDTFPSNVSEDVTDPVTTGEVAPKVMEMLQEVTPMVYNLAAAPTESAPAVSTVFTDSSDRFYDPEN